MKRISFLVFSISFLAAVSGMAQKMPIDTLKLDGLLNLSFEQLMNVSVITPTQSLQKSNEAPATVLVVTMDQIRLRGYRSLADVLNDLPDFIIKDKSDPQYYNTVSLRGVSRQDHFVILLDGVRISSPTNEPLPLLEDFPIYLAKQIEVVYGPGSALYGADAMAGVINIITQKSQDKKNVAVTATGGTQGYQSLSALLSRKLKNDVNVSIAGLYSYDVQPDFSKLYKDQYNMTSHQTGVFNSMYGPITPKESVDPHFAAPVKAYNLYASIDKKGFNMKLLHHYSAVPTSTTFKPDNGVYNKDVFYGQGVTTASATYNETLGKIKSVTTLVGSFYSVDPKSNYRNVYGGMEHGYKYSTGSMIKMEQQLAYQHSSKLNLTGGVTYEVFEAVPKTPELQRPVNKNGAATGVLLNSISENNPLGIEAKFFALTYDNIGSYLQGLYTPAQKISFTIGARYDHNSRFGATFNPRIGSVFHPFEHTTIKTLYGTAYWAPSPMVSYESYGSFNTTDNGTTYQSDFWHLPNPGLKPMTSKTFEVSLQQKVGKHFNVTLTGYKTQIQNLIQDVSDNDNTNLYQNKFLGWNVNYIEVPFNKGIQKNYGGNIMVNSAFRIGTLECNFYSSLSYIQGKEYTGKSDRDVEQASLTPWQTRLGVDGKLKAFYFSVRLLNAGRQRMAKQMPDDPTKQLTIQGYSLMNVSMGYVIEKHATLFLNVQNALNQHYLNSLTWDSTDSNGSYQNPIRAMVGVRVGL